jgi:predicted dienelactone hydrolase
VIHLTALTALLLLPGCTGDDSDEVEPPPARGDPGVMGPYAVGATTVQVADDRGGALTVEVWYPARDPGTAPDPYPEVALALDAHRDAEPDRRGAPYPLVAFSHGFGGIRYQSAFLTEHLASHGFVVVAPDHPNNTIFDLDGDLTGQVLVNRPGDVRRAVDGALGAADLEDLAETDAYAMTGHSFGGVTTLIVGGGVLDFDYAEAHCAEHDDAGCAFFVDTELGDPALATPDPRAVVAVDISPGGWYAFGAGGLDGLVPSMSIAGDRDQDLPYNSEGRPTMEALPGPKHLVVLANAGHWGVTDLCLLLPIWEECQGTDAGWMEPERAQAVVRTLVTAYVGAALIGDPLFDPWLTAEAWPDEDVDLEPVP